MKRLFSVLSALAVAAAFVLMLVDAVVGASTTGFGPWFDRHQLRTMQGWNEIADEHPVVHETFVGYLVVTDGGVYDTNYSAEPALRDLLDRLADE